MIRPTTAEHSNVALSVWPPPTGCPNTARFCCCGCPSYTPRRPLTPTSCCTLTHRGAWGSSCSHFFASAHSGNHFPGGVDIFVPGASLVSYPHGNYRFNIRFSADSLLWRCSFRNLHTERCKDFTDMNPSPGGSKKNNSDCFACILATCEPLGCLSLPDCQHTFGNEAVLFFRCFRNRSTGFSFNNFCLRTNKWEKYLFLFVWHVFEPVTTTDGKWFPVQQDFEPLAAHQRVSQIRFCHIGRLSSCVCVSSQSLRSVKFVFRFAGMLSPLSTWPHQIRVHKVF